MISNRISGDWEAPILAFPIVGKQVYHQPGLGTSLPQEAASPGFMRPPNLIQTNAAFHSKIKGAAV